MSVSTSLDGPQALHDRNRPMRGGQSAYALMRRGKAMLEEAGISVSAIQTTTAASLASRRPSSTPMWRTGSGRSSCAR